MPNNRYNRVTAPTVPDVITPEQKIVYLPSSIVLGDIVLNTKADGAIETKPVSAPPTQDPADIIKPASIRLTDTAITIEASAEFGGSVVLKDLLNTLLDIPVFSVAGVEMPLRSLLSSVLSRVTGVEAGVADLSGVRLPAIVTEQLSNAALDSAREAAQALKDAAQDASGVLVALAAASAASDIAAVAGRVTALESAPAFDATIINNRLDAAEGAIALKANNSDLLEGLLLKANQAEFTVVADRVTAAETAVTGAGARLDALEAAVPSKVAAADYNVYVAANDAAVAAAAAAAASATTAADAATAAVAAKEDIGRIHKTDIVTTDVSGVNPAYWQNSLDGVISAIVSAGKVAEFIYDGPQEVSHFLSVADSAVAGTTYRFKNSSALATWRLVMGSQGGEVVDVAPGETLAVVAYGGGVWKIL